MFQDIEPKTLFNQYKEAAPRDEDFCIVADGEKIMLKNDNNEISFPTMEEIWNILKSGKNRFQDKNVKYLLSVDDKAYFYMDYAEFPIDKLRERGYEFAEKFTFRGAKPNDIAFAGAVCNHIVNFYQNNRFCGRCGSKYEHSATERAMECPRCGQVLYPKINPAVIVAIINKDKILLSKYSVSQYKRYALIAGYTEIGETVEQTVHREVMEETGLRVKNLKYFASQPWPFTQSLLIGFFAELDGSDKVSLDDNELSSAEWFKREDIPTDDTTLSMTKTMIEYFRTHPEEFPV